MLKSLAVNAPPLAAIKKKEGEQVVAAAVIVLITDAIQLVNVTNNMNEYQVRFVTNQILEKYYFLKVDEIRVCLETGITGGYGTIYNRVDAAVILEWFSKYVEMRDSAMELIRNDEIGQQNIYQMFKSDGEEENSLSKVVRYIRDGLDEHGNPIPGKKTTGLIKRKHHPVVNDDEKKFSDWVFRRWDELLRAQPHDMQKANLIKYKGELMNYTMFAEMRYDQRFLVQLTIMNRLGLIPDSDFYSHKS